MHRKNDTYVLSKLTIPHQHKINLKKNVTKKRKIRQQTYNKLLTSPTGHSIRYSTIRSGLANNTSITNHLRNETPCLTRLDTASHHSLACPLIQEIFFTLIYKTVEQNLFKTGASISTYIPFTILKNGQFLSLKLPYILFRVKANGEQEFA